MKMNTKKEYVENLAQNPDINYDKHYIDSISQLNLLMKKTKKIWKKFKTTFNNSSKNDPIVNQYQPMKYLMK